MKEHQRTDRLTIITILLVVFIGVILITYRAPRLSFKLSPEEMLDLVQQTEAIVPVSQVSQLMTDEQIVFVDIRNKGDYVVKHISGAINIPLPKVLDEESMAVFNEEGKTIVLYGEDHTTTNGAWMLLRQLGLENVRMLLGGYSNFSTDSTTFPGFYAHYEEIVQAEFDLNAEIEEQAKRIAEGDAEKVKVAQVAPVAQPVKKQVITAPALPPPPAEEEEEEEGC
jgi:rhodanese-related sulfurtransferase